MQSGYDQSCCLLGTPEKTDGKALAKRSVLSTSPVLNRLQLGHECTYDDMLESQQA